jgi:hypothetical protein
MDMNLIAPLILSGCLAGAVNFFANYIDLPFTKPKDLFVSEPPKLKDIWWIALIGYLIVGIAGSFLTPVINAIVGGLKGLEWIIENGTSHPKEPNYLYILFGYGLIFGYSTTRLLIGLLDSIIKKVSKVETRLTKLEKGKRKDESFSPLTSKAQEIIEECEAQFETYKSDCSGFVKAVTNKFGVAFTGQADDIVNQIQGPDWTILADGVAAKAKADLGWLVIGGLKSSDHTPPRKNGHVVVVVSGVLASSKYPTGYWGTLGGTGRKNTTINYAWVAADRDNVIYSAMQV